MFIQYIFLSFTDGVDVNVTPDKRQIFFQEEKQLLATIKVNLSLHTVIPQLL